jgi:flagellum-specific peptidoglycan hydrolase FlgJ
VNTTRKPWWLQATPLVSLSTSGAILGFSFVPGTAAEHTSPTTLPHLLALESAARPDSAQTAGDAGRSDTALRSAIVNVAQYYLKMARTKTPAQMEAIIWGIDSVNGADHGASCAAFASMTLELAAQSVGQQSWVTGGGSYPWPLHEWADVRVDPNPNSLGVVSILQDAQATGRWHPLGDGYTPQPGDWVLFDEHVEVVTSYRDGVLSTIGANSLPGMTVNAHEFSGSLAADGVEGYVDNGGLVAAGTAPASSAAEAGSTSAEGSATSGQAAIPGAVAHDIGTAPASATKAAGTAKAAGETTAPSSAPTPASASASASAPKGTSGEAAIPGTAAIAATATATATAPAAPPARSYTRHQPASTSPPVPETSAQAAFISAVAPGAIAAQARYGIPAAVTIAQAIDESGWGQSELAAKDHNLFGIKGSGPAGTDAMPTQEYENGQWVTITAYFRMYHNDAESIADHSQLLATNPSYQRAMADRTVPDAFANDLTGVYATDPNYGANLIALMQLYDLYRYDDATPAATATSPAVAAPAASHSVAIGAVPAGAAPTGAAPTDAAATGSVPAVTAPAITAPAASGPRVAAGSASIPGLTSLATARTAAPKYQSQIPAAVTTAYITTARSSIMREEPLYRDVASFTGISWQLLAACDWMQCQAKPRYSPVHGEKLGSVNSDGTVYFTKSEALAQCANDLIELSRTVYQVRLPGRKRLSVTDLANVFAAFRWGGLLRQNNVSAMEFPYSVQGLTAHHTKMRWPKIPAPDAPDRPGTRFRAPFGAVPIVLSLKYPATA